MNMTATPETGPVDAPASMDSVLAEFEAEAPTGGDAADEVAREMVEQTVEGDAQAPDDSEGETEAQQDEPDEPNDDSPEEQEEAPAEDPVHTVKVNGEEIEVPLSELLKGYSRTEDYKAKTMALAEERKGLETQLSTAYENRLKQATDLFVQTDPILAQADQIDWQALAQEDPAAYTQLRAAVDARLGVLGQARQELQRVEAARQEQRNAELQEGIQATEAAIRASDPAFADDAKFGTYVKESITELGSIGLDSEDLQAILANPTVGPKVLALVSDASKFRAQQKAKAGLPQKRVVQVSRVKPLRSDASDGSKTPRRPPSPNASRDAKADYVVKELLDSIGT